jgi:hypothetical protein
MSIYFNYMKLLFKTRSTVEGQGEGQVASLSNVAGTDASSRSIDCIMCRKMAIGCNNGSIICLGDLESHNNYFVVRMPRKYYRFCVIHGETEASVLETITFFGPSNRKARQTYPLSNYPLTAQIMALISLLYNPRNWDGFWMPIRISTFRVWKWCMGCPAVRLSCITTSLIANGIYEL